ncbi:Uncharacterised protein [Starkeya nomas]|uniref:DUF3108 domain-containing protein n=2 Tax=Xanthobacteraceae TaxID=335928 RepID=A0A5S9PUL8_9HYPH|nr:MULTISPECIES: DUF3108 domain-containing protein [Xanthobacteraceae]TSJ63945.1 DUF3108 domain-containing protein [Ancylobacter moscoviensis]CAA0108118.1 Uncharacterised protein [Starkeya nomas]
MKRVCLTAVMAFAGAGATITGALADGRLEARYRMSLGGLELGKAALMVEVDDRSYIASGSGRLTGVVQAVSPGKGTAGARGSVERGALAPRSFAMEAVSDKKSEAIRLVMNGSAVTDMRVEPPVFPSPDRVPIADKDKKGVFDPMTAALIMVPGGADPLSPKACERVLSIFDGRQRYDLALSYERTENVKAEKGYAGPAVVCRVAYRPVAGHKPDRTAVKYMMRNKDIYVWLAPVAGTRMLVPFRASVSTAIGIAELQAEAFETEPVVSKRAAPAKAGVQ